MDIKYKLGSNEEGVIGMEGQQWDTKHWLVNSAVDNTVDSLVNHPQIQEAAQWILADETVAFPTETVYGLGANALSDKAVKKIFEAKGRPADNPLIVHISHIEQLRGIVDNIPAIAQKLMQAFWPGPLTLVLPKAKLVASTVTGGLDTVAVRMPAHPLALALIKACDRPIAAPSANRSGKPSPTQADHVLHDLKGRIVGVLDGGETGVGVESTVLDVTGEKPMILRPGGVSKRQLEQVIGEILVDPGLKDQKESKFQPRSPGVKYQHYAPEAEMWLVSLDHGLEEMRIRIQEQALIAQKSGVKVGILTTEEGLTSYNADIVLSLGSRMDLSTVARQIYRALRQFDQTGIERVYSESFPEEGLGEAIMNRLLKAAGGKML
jgi:L-threonylcarbamoyladenylate synthase